MDHDHEGVGDPRLSAEGELSMARLALDDGELAHAADHVAGALALAPTLPEAHELLARLLADPRADGPEMFPMGERTFLGTVVARAHAMAAHHRYAEGLGLLASAQGHEPDGHWAEVSWVLDPELPARLTPDEIIQVLGRLSGAIGDGVPEERRRAALRPYSELLRGALAAHAGHAQLIAMASIFVRRLGEFDAAADLARRSEAIQPSFMASVALGNAHRAADRWADAEQAFLRALSFDPDNLYLQTDIAELLADAGRADDALTWIQRVLAADPAHESGFPTACALLFGRNNDLTHLLALTDYLRDHPDNDHATGTLTTLSQRRLWLGHIPMPGESVINVAGQVLDQEGPVEGGRLTVSAPEPPSAFLAFGRMLPGFELEISEVPAPDARLPVPRVFSGGPVRGVTGQVWTFDGTIARPAVAPPSPATARAVAELAGFGWRHLPAAYDESVRLAGLPLTELLGVLVHPPQPPEDSTARVWPEWIRRVQARACLGIAHHAADQPWERSQRRQILIDLAYGPEDWVSEAALLAMIANAWADPAIREDVSVLVAWRLLAATEAAQTRPVTILHSLAMLALATPAIDSDVRNLAWDIITAEEGMSPLAPAGPTPT